MSDANQKAKQGCVERYSTASGWSDKHDLTSAIHKITPSKLLQITFSELCGMDLRAHTEVLSLGPGLSHGCIPQPYCPTILLFVDLTHSMLSTKAIMTMAAHPLTIIVAMKTTTTLSASVTSTVDTIQDKYTGIAIFTPNIEQRQSSTDELLVATNVLVCGIL